MRADPWRLADDGDIEMGDPPAPRAQALDGKGEEPVGGDAAPARVGRRKMNTDVAFRKRAEDGIDERMQHDVGIGMPRETAPVRDAHAAEHDVLAGAGGVDVEADAGA